MSTTVKGLPPKIQLANKYNAQGAYPSVKTQDLLDNIEQPISFDDRHTIVFGTYPNIHFPNALVTGSFFDTVGSTIVTTGTQSPVASDSGLYLTLGTSSYVPYKENNLILDESEFAMTGTDIPGWNQRLGNKLSFTIDVSANSSKQLYRLPSSSLEVGSTLTSTSGFCYYNFQTGKWEDIGLTDAKGNKIDYSPFVTGTVSTDPTKSYRLSFAKDVRYPKQFFITEPDYGNGTTSAERFAEGTSLKRTGAPTAALGAPYLPLYHATGSQTIKMSNYISDPIAVEKIQLKIPVILKRGHGKPVQVNTNPARTAVFYAQNGKRAHDNYFFFLYRQARSTGQGEGIEKIATGSTRFLFASATVTAYNSPSYRLSHGGYSPISYDAGYDTYSSSMGGRTTSQEREDSYLYPNFQSSAEFDFNLSMLALNDGTQLDSNIDSEIKANLVLNFGIGNANAQRLGQDYFPSVDTTGLGKTQSTVIDYWPGGSTTQKFVTQSLTPIYADTQIFVSKNFLRPTPNALGILNITDDPKSQIDSRFVTAPSPVGPLYAEESILAGSPFYPTNQSSPYILFPEDEIILGAEAGIQQVLTTMSGTLSTGKDAEPLAWYVESDGTGAGNHIVVTGSRGSVTSSMMIINQGAASLTFYGSVLKENKPIPYTLNQHLTSIAIHESLHSDNPIFDQYDIEPAASYSGSYISEYFRGKLTSTSDRTALNYAGVGATGSLLRAVRLSSEGETYYDSLTPDPVKFALLAFSCSNATNGDLTITSGTIIEPLTTITPGSGMGNLKFTATLSPFQSESISGRGANTVQSFTLSGDGFSFQYPSPQYPLSIDLLRRYLFTRGWNINDMISRTQSSATTYKNRYGLINYVPTKTSAVFRRDRFGYFRDMLEQRPYATFAQDVGFGFKDPVVVSTFVSASTETRVDPYQTRLVNVSIYSTSSVPFTDGQSTRTIFPSASYNPVYKPTLVLQ